MPHFALTNDLDLSHEEGLYYRAKIHITEVDEVFSKDVSHGISVLYDALVHGLQWYGIKEQIREEEKDILKKLVESGKVAEFDLDAFESLMEDALDIDYSEYNFSKLLSEVKSILDKIGITPDISMLQKIRKTEE